MIIGVAICHEGSFFSLPQPNRHHDLIKHMVEEKGIKPPITGEQGFYNHEYIFFNREDALNTAMERGQIKDNQHPTKLFSEDLW